MSNRVRFGRSRSSKVNHFGTNRKRVYDFLLVGHRNYGSILHRFWDTAIYWLKITHFSYPTLIRRPLMWVCGCVCLLCKRLKVKGLDIYIPPLTGKPRPAAVYNWSGVLTGNDTTGAAQVAAAHCPHERLWTPQSAARQTHLCPSQLHWPSPRNVLRQRLTIFSSKCYQILIIATHLPTTEGWKAESALLADW